MKGGNRKKKKGSLLVPYACQGRLTNTTDRATDYFSETHQAESCFGFLQACAPSQVLVQSEFTPNMYLTILLNHSKLDNMCCS